jgi:hypothetical protein
MYSSLVIIRVVESRRMKLAGHAAHIGKIKNDYNISVGKSEDHLDEL